MPPTVLALHYWAGAGRAFDAVRALLPAGTSLCGPDLPGFGRQPAPPNFDYSVSAYADWVAGYAQHHAPGDFVLLGHSMGGKIALALAARRPAGLRGVVLLAPSPPAGEPMTDEDRAAALAAHGHPEAAEKTFRKITGLPLSAVQHRQVIADNLRSTRAAWDAWLRAGAREDITGLLVGLAGPCQLLVGAQDRAIASATQRRLTLPHLPAGTRCTVVPGAGHLLPLEAPAAVAAALAL